MKGEFVFIKTNLKIKSMQECCRIFINERFRNWSLDAAGKLNTIFNF
jgi:hypothetical protein